MSKRDHRLPRANDIAGPALGALPERWATRNEVLRESSKAFGAEINTMERISAQPHTRAIAATTVRRRLEGANWRRLPLFCCWHALAT
jgi:hypothetical protein